jgi:rhamnogalacturonyl hydrolase YesR
MDNKRVLVLAALIMGNLTVLSQQFRESPEFDADSIIALMHSVNEHFQDDEWKRNDRNWIRGTYYTGLMAFQRATGDQTLLAQAQQWSAKHGWRTGTEWIYPANRMTCVQTYLELYFLDPAEEKIGNAREFMDVRKDKPDPAADQGWDYVDALYVGTPAWVMMSEATGDPAYAAYGNRLFRDVFNDLYDQDHHLFYRDVKAREESSASPKPVFWSRGNGWAFASIPRILDHLPESDTSFTWYLDLFKQMAAALKDCQGDDGFWRTSLLNPMSYPGPESSGTAFFTYGLAWGINNGYLEEDDYGNTLGKAWTALYHHVDADGKVLWGQGVARKPGNVGIEDSHEYVSGAFLLAGSEVIKLIGTASGD